MQQPGHEGGWSRQPARNLKNEVTARNGLRFVRTEIKAGGKSGTRADKDEKFLVVLSGAYRLDLPQGPVSLEALEMARIPAGVDYCGEALKDTILLVSHHGEKKPAAGERRTADQDADQYLWGV